MNRSISIALMAAAVVCGGCATALTVDPSDLPMIERQLEADPTDASLLQRHAVGLYAAGDCGRAIPAGEAASRAAPSSEVGTLVQGMCLEQSQQYDRAISIYESYLEAYGRESGASAVAARAELAARALATQLAQAAIAGENPQRPADPETTGVLPLVIVGDSALDALSLGLAHMMTTDLSLLRRFPVVERLQLQALLDEMRLAATDRVDPQTAVRVGRMVGAGRLVQGSMIAQLEETTSLNASVVLTSGDVVQATGEEGATRDLLALEKQLVLSLAGDLGYVLTEAERQRILDNGPRNLRALLAFSDGLLAESHGDWATAAEHYGAALRADPSFTEARQRLQITAALAAMPPGFTAPLGTLGDELDRAVQDELRYAGVESQPGARIAGIIDLTGHQSERSPPGDPIDIVVDPPRGPEPSSFLINFILRLQIPGR